ncbi:TraB/GumN family protein [Salipiger sp. P9]|uniref:TraB/GumN family protein n=1 Tax=Salipiger pentaromativorans TaxID=2943193 RepID=UPI0021587526|nr:TraB/GumN family protein [Salipiger pentaromativorans]MCR8550760.1 TraB/GumN family protein [Salipiger pentaromativorans]
MFRTLLAFSLWLSLAAAGAAQCVGQDLRQTLNPEERARLDLLMADVPYASGNRWRAERDGEIIHLVGTIHLSDPRLGAPLERLRPVVAASGAVLLEMPRAEQAKLMQAISSQPGLLLLTDKTLPELMPEEDWAALAEAAEAHGIPPFMAAKFRPWYLSMMLALPACAKSALDSRDGLDFRIEALAEAQGVPTVALESFDTTFGIFNAEPLDEQIEMMSVSLTTQGEDADGMATTIAAYFDEAAGEMWKFSEIQIARSGLYTPEEAAQMMQESGDAILSQRNHAWIEVILQTAKTTEKPIVAAFGAAHLPGEDGVLNLLARAGFTLTREPF